MSIEFFAQRLLWVFRRSGDSGDLTREFGKLSSDRQEALRTAARLENDDVPLIGQYNSDSDWLIISAKLVAWSTGVVTTIPLRDLEDCTVELQPNEHVRTKSDLRTLRLLTKTGQHTITVESGPPFMAVGTCSKRQRGGTSVTAILLPTVLASLGKDCLQNGTLFSRTNAVL